MSKKCSAKRRLRQPPRKVSEFIRWQFKYGKDSGSAGISDGDFIKKMREQNPTHFKNKPEIDAPELELWEFGYVEAFYRLSPSRAIGFGGIGHIPLSEITNYADKPYFCIIDPEIFVYVIQAADNAYMDEHNKAQESKSGVK